jgi:ribA/ribD-fused uncharacterized protein
MAVERFQGEYRFLSNFFPSPVTYGDVTYPTAEHAYQAAKTREPAVRSRVASLATPGEAKRYGRLILLREGWERAKKPVMLVVVLTKFTQNPELGAMLADTADVDDPLLTEGNHWHDNYWGDCYCPKCEAKPGLNYLGRVLMAVRDTVRCD